MYIPLVLASSEDDDTSVRYNEFSTSLCFVKMLRTHPFDATKKKMSFVSSVAVSDHIVQVDGLNMVCSSVIPISTVHCPLLGMKIYSANH